MKIISEISISSYQFRQFVLDTIITSYLGGFQFADLCVTVAHNAIKKGLVEHPIGKNEKHFNFDMNTNDKKKLHVLVDELMEEGILKIGNAYGKSWPFLSLSDSYTDLWKSGNSE
jgi:hypothetical protein